MDDDKQARETRERLLNGVRQTMQTPEGRELLRFILDDSGFFMAVGMGTSSEELNHFEGRRAVGAHLHRLLTDADPQNIVKLTEHDNG